MKGNQYTKGHKLSDEHKEKISKAHKGKKRPQCSWHHTEEQKKQMSIKMKERSHKRTQRKN